ncbi:monovalent cation/H+ antiporter subunit D [Kaistia geumhonensis]|nr:monovalent cation/H+ antiporter subunit D [Kaistia geumhonensis]MCX5480119.1 monovalent cation/H+ antiporter subunit D [Kaistia geumhonensis]
MRLADHLLIVPIVLPLVTGALLLLFDERRHILKATIGTLSTLVLAGVAIALLLMTNDGAGPASAAYLLGDWPAPFGIVLVLDRLSAMMLVTSSLLGVAALLFALARWHKSGPHFHSLFQFLLMGLSGAFLTGDLFNLFVFFEVMLAASYALLLHGSGAVRVRAGLHYIAINLVASFLFLIGVSLIYSVTGTLNMADLAGRIAGLSPDHRGLLEAGTAILGIAFLVKAGMWPLCFWLPGAYAAAAAPVAAVFAVLSKVGVYAVFRLSPLLLGVGAGSSAGLPDRVLLVGGLATVAFGMIGVLASQALARLAAFSVIVSSGTLLAAAGMADVATTAGALFYLVSSTFTIGALFLLVELVERTRDPAAQVLAVTSEVYGDDEGEEVAEVGIAIPATLAILGTCFALCGILVAGLPPFSGFVGKFALLSAVVGAGDDGEIRPASWAFLTLVILSGLFAMVAMIRAGIHIFWAPAEAIVPRVRVIEFAPVALLLGLCAAMTVGAGPLMRYATATAEALHAPAAYIDSVRNTARVTAGDPR